MDELDHGGNHHDESAGVSSAPADSSTSAGAAVPPPLWMMYSGNLADQHHIGMEALPDDGVPGLHVRADQGIELFEIHCGGLRLANRRILGAPIPVKQGRCCAWTVLPLTAIVERCACTIRRPNVSDALLSPFRSAAYPRTTPPNLQQRNRC